jgi:hypothetical protein
MKKNHLYLFFPLLLLFLNCENFLSGTFSNKNFNQSYVPFDVGDVRQIIVVQDSSTILMSVIGKEFRSDGVSVFCMEWKYGTSSIERYYYLITDEYYLGTELDTTSRTDVDIRINPFAEQRLAKLYPSDGEIFIHTPGSQFGDYWITTKDSSIETFCGVFNDVYRFTLIDNWSSSPILSTYYAKGVGYIGTASAALTQPEFLASYVKVGNNTIGSLWPEKDYTGGGGLTRKKDIPKFLLDGFRLNSKDIVSTRNTIFLKSN